MYCHNLFDRVFGWLWFWALGFFLSTSTRGNKTSFILHQMIIWILFDMAYYSILRCAFADDGGARFRFIVNSICLDMFSIFSALFLLIFILSNVCAGLSRCFWHKIYRIVKVILVFFSVATVNSSIAALLKHIRIKCKMDFRCYCNVGILQKKTM